MTKEHHVIFVPGLNDHRKGYELLVARWLTYGIIPHVHRIGWHDEEIAFEHKLKRLVNAANLLIDQENTVSLVGGSAGGSAVLNAFLEQPKITAVVNLCGRLRAGENVFPSLKLAAKKSTSFKESVLLFESREPAMKEKQRGRVLTLRPVWDEVVPRTTVSLHGANNQTLPSVEHMISGVLGITLFAPIIINFIKEQTDLKELN